MTDNEEEVRINLLDLYIAHSDNFLKLRRKIELLIKNSSDKDEKNRLELRYRKISDIIIFNQAEVSKLLQEKTLHAVGNK